MTEAATQRATKRPTASKRMRPIWPSSAIRGGCLSRGLGEGGSRSLGGFAPVPGRPVRGVGPPRTVVPGKGQVPYRSSGGPNAGSSAKRGVRYELSPGQGGARPGQTLVLLAPGSGASRRLAAFLLRLAGSRHSPPAIRGCKCVPASLTTLRVRRAGSFEAISSHTASWREVRRFLAFRGVRRRRCDGSCRRLSGRSLARR
jgi:hypothetical protein